MEVEASPEPVAEPSPEPVAGESFFLRHGVLLQVTACGRTDRGYKEAQHGVDHSENINNKHSMCSVTAFLGIAGDDYAACKAHSWP